MTLDIGWYLTRARTRTRMLQAILAMPQIGIVVPVEIEGVEVPGETMIDTVVVLIVVVRGEIHGGTESENEETEVVTAMIAVDTRIYPVRNHVPSYSNKSRISMTIQVQHRHM